MFIGREKELLQLKEKINSKNFESILLYGRRRIGKTKLISEAINDYNGTYIYYECKRSLVGDNLESFNETINRILNQKFNFKTFKDALYYLFKYGVNKDIVLVIDEFPFIYEGYNGIVSDVRDLIDEFNDLSKIKLILSGSYIDVMKSLNDFKSETYGRFTGIIELKPFDYYDSSMFYSTYSDEDKILMYSVFGGVAFFNSLINENESAITNIKKLLVQNNAILQLEVERMMASEISKLSLLNSVIELISRGVYKYSDIVKNLTVKSGSSVNPDYILKKLIDLEIIVKEVPINDQKNKKRTFYYFKDNLIEFYYRYIYRNKNMSSIMSCDDFFDEFIKQDLFTQYIPKKFEYIAREFLIRKNIEGSIKPVIYEIGTYSFNDMNKKINRQFDVVTKDKNGYISYECKYINSVLGEKIVREEEYQIISSGIDVYKLGFISKNGFSDEVSPDKYNLFSLKDFYKKKS